MTTKKNYDVYIGLDVHKETIALALASPERQGEIRFWGGLQFEQWDELFDDSTMTIAAIDRLVHHATILHCEGESYRRKMAMSNGS